MLGLVLLHCLKLRYAVQKLAVFVVLFTLRLVGGLKSGLRIVGYDLRLGDLAPRGIDCALVLFAALGRGLESGIRGALRGAALVKVEHGLVLGLGRGVVRGLSSGVILGDL